MATAILCEDKEDKRKERCERWGSGVSVLRGAFDVVDDEGGDGAFGGFEL